MLFLRNIHDPEAPDSLLTLCKTSEIEVNATAQSDHDDDETFTTSSEHLIQLSFDMNDLRLLSHVSENIFLRRRRMIKERAFMMLFKKWMAKESRRGGRRRGNVIKIKRLKVY
jgi:hypothetical protein